MRLTKSQKWLITSSSIIILSFLWLTREVAPPPLTDKEKVVIESLFENKKPQCIGRYIIDIPESFNNDITSKTFIDDIKIESEIVSSQEFKNMLVEIEKKFNEINTNEEKTPYIKQAIRLNNGIIYDRNILNRPDFTRELEAHVYIDGVAFVLYSEIFDLSDEKHNKIRDRFLKNNFTINNKSVKLNELTSLINRMKGRAKDETPTDKGICIQNGFILDDKNKHREDIIISILNDQFNFSVSINNTYDSSNKSLLDRKNEISETIKKDKLLTLKKGTINNNGIKGEEWLISAKGETNEENVQYYNFQFYANEKNIDYLTPEIGVNLNNSNKIITSYSNNQMVEIWDRIVNSLRYRPNAF